MKRNSLCEKCREQITYVAHNDPDQLIDSKLVVRLGRLKKELNEIIFAVERALSRRLFE